MAGRGVEAAREYYRRIGLVDGNEEERLWEQLVLTRPPAVVRVNNTKQGSQAVLKRLKENERWTAVDWFPCELVWKCESNVFTSHEEKEMREWVDKENLSYGLRYQEVASLLPPLLLNVYGTEGHRVLDMCASPGSKTLETLELLRGLKRHTMGGMDDAFLLVANDLPGERSRKLASFLKRAESPAILVTNGDAANFPFVFSSRTDTVSDTVNYSSESKEEAREEKPIVENESKHGREESEGELESFLFTRVLADVPCSGDGTLRKTPAVLKGWTVSFALGIHRKQLKILMRGLHLLQEGGRLVYSTCSMNPIENEAVVMAALDRLGDNVTLLNGPQLTQEITGDCGELKISPGIPSWPVLCPNIGALALRSFSTWAEAEAADDIPRDTVTPSMFPSEDAISVSEKCIRISPLDNDTSGFFVAVFEKRSQRVDKRTERELEKGLTWIGRNEKNVWRVLGAGDKEYDEIRDFYGLMATPGHVLLSETNVEGNWNAIVMVSTVAWELLSSRFPGRRRGYSALSAGVTVFKRLRVGFMPEARCRWRPTSEGASLVASLASKRLVRIPSDDILASLVAATTTAIDSLLCDGSVAATDLQQENGPVIVIHDESAVPGILSARHLLILHSK